MNSLKKIFSYSSKELLFKLNNRIEKYRIANSVIRSNPIFYKLSYQIRLGKPYNYNSKDNILVVGCMSAIGNALVNQFIKKGSNVYGTYFNSKPEKSILFSENFFQLDISSTKSINDFYNKLEKKNIQFDLIITATGDFPEAHISKIDLENITEESLQKEQQQILNTININAIGPYLILKRLLPLIRDSKKEHKFVSQFCVLTSSLGTMHNEIYGGLYPYRVSKGALHSIFLGIYCDLRLSRNIGILMAGPGSVKSKMNPFGNTSPEKSAKEIIKNLEFSSKKANYQFLGLEGKRIPW